MEIVNFMESDSGTGKITRLMPAADSSVEGSTRWDIDLVFEEIEDTKTLNEPMPSSRDYLARARDGKASADIKVKPTDKDFLLSIDGVFSDQPAEIREIKLSVTEKAQTLRVRVRVGGVSPEESGLLLARQGKPVLISTDTAQLQLGLGGGGEGSDLKRGMLVRGQMDGAVRTGTFVKMNNDGDALLNNFGVTYAVETVIAAISLPDASIELVERYKTAMDREGRVPSWAVLIDYIVSNDGKLTAHALDEILNLPPEPEEMEIVN